MVKTVSDLTEFEAILKDNKMVVVDFFAQWCGPCKVIAPEIEKLSHDDANKSIVFLKVDVDEAEEIATKYEIRAMPTFIYFKDGAKLTSNQGASLPTVKANIEKLKA